jgi:hypothetical protein
MSLIPSHLVSAILSLKNGTDTKSPVIVGVNPETGAQTVQPNPVRVAAVKELVKEAAQLLKQHRRAALLSRQIDQKIAEEEDLEADEFSDDPEYFREAIAEFAAQDPEIDELVKQCAYSEYGVDEWNMSNEPISLAFYKKAFAIAETIKTLSPKMRVEYLYRAILAIHCETPALAVSLHTFVQEYAQGSGYGHPELCELARSFLTEEEKEREDTDQEYEPITSYNGEDSLDVLLWAKKNKNARSEWLARVTGSCQEKEVAVVSEDEDETDEKERNLAMFKAIVDNIIADNPHKTKEEIATQISEIIREVQK